MPFRFLIFFLEFAGFCVILMFTGAHRALRGRRSAGLSAGCLFRPSVARMPPSLIFVLFFMFRLSVTRSSPYFFCTFFSSCVALPSLVTISNFRSRLMTGFFVFVFTIVHIAGTHLVNKLWHDLSLFGAQVLVIFCCVRAHELFATENHVLCLFPVNR